MVISFAVTKTSTIITNALGEAEANGKGRMVVVVKDGRQERVKEGERWIKNAE